MDIVVRYHIWVEDLDSGEIYKAFTWRGTEAAGIRRAWTDAKMFNRRLKRVWALEAPSACALFNVVEH